MYLCYASNLSYICAGVGCLLIEYRMGLTVKAATGAGWMSLGTYYNDTKRNA